VGEVLYDDANAPVPGSVTASDSRVASSADGRASELNCPLQGIRAGQLWNRHLLAACRGDQEFILALETGRARRGTRPDRKVAETVSDTEAVTERWEVLG
jgi:hypothetical protein